MEKTLKKFLVIVSFLFISSPVIAGDAPTFTDQDLEKYKYRQPYDNDKSVGDFKTSDKTEGSEKPATVSKEKEQKHKRYEVPYLPYEGTSRRIIIPVKFNDSVSVLMVLDTGAPTMHISNRLAEKLGIFDRDDGKLFEKAAIGGKTTWSVLTIIESVQVGGAKDFFIPATVIPPLSDYYEGVIGMDFMGNYSFHIDTRKQVVVFDELPPRANMPGGHDESWWRTTFRTFASKRAEWKRIRDDLYNQRDDSRRIRELREFSDRQYKEADKLLNRVNGYAIEHAVPMEWREY